MPSPSRGRAELQALAAALVVATALSAWSPADGLTWWLEAAPVLIGFPLALATRRASPLTPLLYRLLFLHALILLAGAHYTYARVPLGDWAREAFGLSRNPYDRLGHFAQGFVPALLARELLARLGVVRSRGWRFFLVLCVCLAFSAFYELIEWWAALALGQGAEAFLGTQGDPWDTQWDMALALAGAGAAQALLGARHDRELARLGQG